MTLVANISGRLKTAVVAAFVFALLAASLSAAHALPCLDLTNAQSVSASGKADGVAAHANLHGSSKRTDRSIDRCCQKSCATCLSVVRPAAPFDGITVARDHSSPIEIQSAGISVGPPHRPPRT
uniref:Uncharacterized protein n=1 Tax=Chelativorans sp. (strain BNC1) TaxID=266779 RepID=Q11BH7_CHESB